MAERVITIPYKYNLDREKFEELYYKNISMTEMSRFFGCSKTTILRRTKSWNLAKRDVDEAWRQIRWSSAHRAMMSRDATGKLLRTEMYPKDFVYASRVAVIRRAKKERGDKCEMCGWNLCTVDGHHIVPVYKGGLNVLDNIKLLCPNCHRAVEHNKIQL